MLSILPGEARSTQRDAELALCGRGRPPRSRRPAESPRRSLEPNRAGAWRVRGGKPARMPPANVDAAGLAARAWQLGEGTLAESLAARRLAFGAPPRPPPSTTASTPWKYTTACSSTATACGHWTIMRRKPTMEQAPQNKTSLTQQPPSTPFLHPDRAKRRAARTGNTPPS